MRRLLEVGATFACLTALNFVFHQLVAADFFNAKLDGITKPAAELGPVWPGLVYFLSAISMVFCARTGQNYSTQRTYAMVSGAAVGLLTFGTWNFINYGWIPGWPLSIVIVDSTWHVVCGPLVGAFLALGLQSTFK